MTWGMKQIKGSVAEEVVGGEGADGEAGGENKFVESARVEVSGWVAGVRVGWVSREERGGETGTNSYGGGGREESGIADVVPVTVGPD
jgi:hypothetical protein